MECDEAVFKALLNSGIPGTKYAWPIDGAPPLPWFTYKRRKGGHMHADNSNYAHMVRYQIDLYEAEPDVELRERFGKCVASVGPYTDYETWIPSENCWETTYDVTYHNH